MNPNKVILLVGEWKSTNLGDQVICLCVEKIIHKYFNNIETIRFDATFGFGYTFRKRIALFPYRLYYKIFKDKEQDDRNFKKCQSKWIEKDITSIQKKIDLIVFCGGQMFLDFFAAPIYVITNFAKDWRIPIYWNACGGGKCSRLSTKIFKESLSISTPHYLTVRDNVYFFSKILNEKPKLIPDPAVNSYDLLRDDDKTKYNKIGLGIMNPDCFKEYNIGECELISFWKVLISNLIVKGYSVELFINGSESDEIFLSKVLANIVNMEITVAPKPKTGHDLVKLISSYNKIISFRLHSHIIAYSCKIPSFGFVWDNKVTDFFKLIRKEYDLCELNDLDIEKIMNFVISERSDFSELERLKKSSKSSIICNIKDILFD